MKKTLLSLAAAPLILTSVATTASAADGINIFDDIKVTGEIRPRYERASVSNNNKKTANAYTVRTKINVNAKLFGIDGLSSNIGVISVNNFGSDKYNSTANGQTQYDVIVDPQAAMISNADINYKIGKTTLHAGRSQVNLDNQRFIGTVGWRQYERSYDTVYVADNSVEGLSLLAAWVYGAQGVKDLPTLNANSVLLNASYTVMPELKITAYDYMVAVDDTRTGMGGKGNDTYGVALTGKIDAGAKFSYRAEYAKQKDATMKYQKSTSAVNAYKADATYYNLDLGANISGILAGVNYEFLSGTTGSDNKTAFNPALGTNHKFNGWADVFYVSAVPTGGLKDMNVRLGYKAKGLGKILGVYHSYKADKAMNAAVGVATTNDLGSEFDIVYVNAIPGVKNLTGLVKYAQYSKGQAAETGLATWNHDKKVAWVQLDYKFSTK